MRVATVTIPLVLDSVFIAGFSVLALAAVSRRSARARWANFLFPATVILGLAYSIINLMLDTRWMILGAPAYNKLVVLLHYVGGLLLGLLISLFVSGQIEGTKRL